MVAGRHRPRVLAVFVAIALALSSIGAGLVVIASSPDWPGRAVSDGASHRFLAERPNGEPMRWNPCEPIRYVVNLNGAPEGSLADVHEAVRRISEATGIRFVFMGETTEELSQSRSSYEPALYEDEWAPVLIAWVDPDETDIRFERGKHEAVALARPIAEFWPGDAAYVSGWIAVRTDEWNRPGWGPGEQGPVLLHEFGHVVGLDHVRDPGEIMAPAVGWVSDLGPGDREGLRLLGREQGCIDTPGPLE